MASRKIQNGHLNSKPQTTVELTNKMVDIDLIDGRESNGDSRSKRDHTQNGTGDEAPIKNPGFFVSWRFVIVILLHSTFLAFVLVRNCMPIAIVCMATAPRAEVDGGNSTTDYDNSTYRDSNHEFVWDTEFQGLVLSSVSFLSFLAPILTNLMTPSLGQRSTLTLMTVVTTIFSFVTPIATRTNRWLLVVCRILTGATFGCNMPIMGDIIAWWGPDKEKQTMVSMVLSGFQIGGILTSLLSGYLCSIPVDNGWPFIFYVIGILNLVVICLWHLLISDKPENHRFISEQELRYIQSGRRIKETNTNKKTERPPYKIIFRSIPVWVFLACSSLHNWTVNLFFTYQAIFLAAALEFTTAETGVLMSLFSVVRFMGMGLWTSINNYLIRSSGLSVTAVKKIIIVSTLCVCTGIQVAITLLEKEDRWTIVGLFMLSMVAQSSGACIFPALPQDMAPRYAGFITGLFFSFGSLLSISGPLIVAALTPNNTVDEWRYVWILLASVFFAIMTLFGLFGDSSLQPWAEEPRFDAPIVTSPLDAMQKRFSVAMNAPPLLTTASTGRSLPSISFEVQSKEIVEQNDLDSERGQMHYPNGNVNIGFEADDFTPNEKDENTIMQLSTTQKNRSNNGVCNLSAHDLSTQIEEPLNTETMINDNLVVVRL